MQQREVESVRRALAAQEASGRRVVERIEHAVESGWSLNRLAAELGISRQALSARLKRADS